MAAVVLNEGHTLGPDEFEAFLDAQPDLSPKTRPRYVRIAADLPSTATHKVLKRQLIAESTAIGPGETLWQREERGTSYRDAKPSPAAPGAGSAPSTVAPV
jgi:fatty-acyl-CoA synthase